MIPYDDLVIALASWRAKQGLPVAQLSGAPAPVTATPRAASPPPGPPPRPPAPPPRGATPPPLARDDLDVDSSLIEEAHYDNEGDDFAMAFSALEQPDEAEATAIGVPPPPARDSFGGLTQPDNAPPTETAPSKRRRNQDW